MSTDWYPRSRDGQIHMVETWLMEVLARLDPEGIRTLATFPANVQVTVELVR